MTHHCRATTVTSARSVLCELVVPALRGPVGGLPADRGFARARLRAASRAATNVELPCDTSPGSAGTCTLGDPRGPTKERGLSNGDGIDSYGIAVLLDVDASAFGDGRRSDGGNEGAADGDSANGWRRLAERVHPGLPDGNGASAGAGVGGASGVSALEAAAHGEE